LGEQDTELTLVLADNDEASLIAGVQDQHLKAIEDQFHTTVIPRGNQLLVRGSAENVRRVQRLVGELTKLVRRGHPLSASEVRYAAQIMSGEDKEEHRPSEVMSDVVVVSDRGKPVRPKSAAQREYVDAIRSNDLVFGIGPAGTGKTYLAMAAAVDSFARKQVSRIILTRPAVEAGERLGFLPGDLQAKVDPYLRPLFDALYDMMDHDKLGKLLERNVIEVAPLAFMRGRTLNDSFIILDEAQNTTPEQMKMFLTRMGFGSKCVVTGDVTQIDLPRGQVSGLNQAREILNGVEGIAFVYFSERDVVRHDLVQKIIKAYNHLDGEQRKAT